MHYALTAAVLTMVYLALLATDPPRAAGVAVFYLVAVLVLIVAQRRAGT